MAQQFANLSLQASENLERFIKAFVRAERRARWFSVMAMKPGAWVGASAYDCAVSPFQSKYCKQELILRDAGLLPSLDKPAHIFAIGAGAGAGHVLATLRHALTSPDTKLEFVASLVSGSMAVCYGHAGEIRICQTPDS